MLSTRQRQRLKDLRKIVDEHQYKELDGYVVDVQTANWIVTLHDSLNPANQRRLLNLSLPEAQRVSIKLLTAE